MDWTECHKKKFVKGVKKDDLLITSLRQSSSNKLVSCKRLELDSTTSSAKVSLAYDSLRELLEALALEKGFKIYNHDCFGAFLRSILQESLLAEDFDRFRKIRNGINYYGKELDLKEAKSILEGIAELIGKIKDIYFKA